MKKDLQPQIRWEKDRVPVSEVFEDSYYNDEDGLAEALEVYLEGNGLPGRWAQEQTGEDVFVIAELGFGVGLNFLASLQSWLNNRPETGRLHFVSFEKYLPSLEDCRRAWSRWPQIEALGLETLRKKTPGTVKGERGWPHQLQGGEATDSLVFPFPGGQLEVILGDVNETLPCWPGLADAWYLDGFSPAKNPQMWQVSLFRLVRDRSRAGASFSTFTSVGDVRRGLISAGFEVQKVKGHGRKRHRLQGYLPDCVSASR